VSVHTANLTIALKTRAAAARRGRRLAPVWPALLLLLVACLCTAGNAQELREEQVKAAFLYNFTKFIDWPDSAFPGSSPFVVCVFADDGFRRELETILSNEQVRGRQITVAPPPVQDIRSCHLVYFARGESERHGKLLEAAKQAPVLTVGEGRRFLEQGGLIAFLLENDRVRFAVSKRGADAAGLAVSSKLLRVARPFDEKQP
jgi:hypothetical protein